MAERKIVGALGFRGQVYAAGREDALYKAAIAAGADLSPFVGEGKPLSGDWKPSKAPTSSSGGGGSTATAGTASTGSASTGTTSGELAADFPSREILAAAGYKTLEQVKGATDEQLLALDGIGPAKLEQIRKA